MRRLCSNTNMELLVCSTMHCTLVVTSPGAATICAALNTFQKSGAFSPERAPIAGALVEGTLQPCHQQDGTILPAVRSLFNPPAAVNCARPRHFVAVS